MSSFSVKPLVYAGASVALAVLFSYVFAIQTIFVRITFGFLPIAIYGAMYGPMKAGLVAAAADFIGTAHTEGTKPLTPPHGDNGKTYTREQLKGLSAEEINANWAAVQAALKGE